MSYIDNHDKWDRTLEQIKIWKPSLYKKFINDKDLNLYD